MPDVITEARPLSGPLGLGHRAPVDPVRRAAALRERYGRDRAALQALVERRLEDLPAALWAAADLVHLAVHDVPALVRHPATAASPFGAEVRRGWDRIRGRFGALLRTVPEALTQRRSAETVAAVLGLAEALETVVRRQLPLVHREEVPGYDAGLDPQALYPSYRGAAANRGRLPRVTGEAAPRWHTSIGGLIWPSAVVDRHGNLYTGHADGEFVSLTRDGEVRWRLHDDRMLYIDSTSALGRDGFLYLASTDVDPGGHQNQGRIWKVDPATGEVQWTFWGRHFEDPEADPHAHLSSFFEGNVSLGLDDGRVTVYAGSDDGTLYKLDDQGNLVWEYSTDSYPSGVIWTKPLISPDGDTVYIGDLAGQVHAVEAQTGRRRWCVRVGGSVVSSLALGRYGELFFGSFDGRVYALDPADGTVFWTYQTLGLIYASPAITETGDVIIGSSDGGIYGLDRFGRKRWVYRTDEAVKSSPLIDPEGRIYVGNGNGKVYCLDGSGRRVWSYQTHADVKENDINASCSLGAGGAILVGSTTGHVWSIPRDLHEQHPGDPALCTDPGDDGRQPDLPPGGATTVFMDRYGTPRFEPPERLPVTDNLNLAFFAVDEELNIVAAELVADTVQVTLSPEIPHEARVESMGRFVYVLPEAFLPYDTRLTVRVTGRYRVEGREKDFASETTLRTEARPGSTSLPIRVGDAVVMHGAKMCQPKEIDALGQAMLDSLHFAIAPIFIDEDQGVLACAVSDVVTVDGGFAYTPRSVNKMAVAGTVRDGFFRVEGALRLIAQGANIPVERFRLSGRITGEPGLEVAHGTVITAARNVPDFADLIRVMHLADDRDDVVGFTTVSSAPYAGVGLGAPDGLAVDLGKEAGRVVATVTAPGTRAEEHWINVVFLDTLHAEILASGEAEVETDAQGVVTAVSAPIPPGAGNGVVVLLTLDLHVAGTLAL